MIAQPTLNIAKIKPVKVKFRNQFRISLVFLGASSSIMKLHLSTQIPHLSLFSTPIDDLGLINLKPKPFQLPNKNALLCSYMINKKRRILQSDPSMQNVTKRRLYDASY